ncbi:MAG: hypothetical protein ACRC5H_06580, partial [Treponemataceae bacterium]
KKKITLTTRYLMFIPQDATSFDVDSVVDTMTLEFTDRWLITDVESQKEPLTKNQLKLILLDSFF